MTKFKVVLIILFFPSLALSQEGDYASCSSELYKPKKEGVPVYEDVSLTSAVVGRADFGDRLCVVGKDKDFLIVDRTTSKFKAEAGYEFKEDAKLIYARKFDYWKIANHKVEGEGENIASKAPLAALISQAKKYFQYMRQGGVPEDPLAPYREMKDNYVSEEEPACEGEDCE